MTTITWLCHSKANPAPLDFDRDLSEDGINLAVKRRKSLGDPQFDMVIHSNLERTRQTARIVANIPEEAPTIVVPQLRPVDGDSIGDAITRMYNQIGNASLDAYMSRVRNELTVMARMAALAIHHHVFYKPSYAKPRNVLVVGHAVMTSAVCYETGHHFDVSKLRSSVLGECEGYIVTYGEFGDWHDFELLK